MTMMIRRIRRMEPTAIAAARFLSSKTTRTTMRTTTTRPFSPPPSMMMVFPFLSSDTADTPRQRSITSRHFHPTPTRDFGMFDDMKTFLSRLTLRAEASHILVKGTDSESEQKIIQLQKLIGNDVMKFADVAKQTSDCPSGKQGGSLGSFGRYTMVPEFDTLVFDENSKVGVVYGPIKTRFGYHLILIQSRNDQ